MNAPTTGPGAVAKEQTAETAAALGSDLRRGLGTDVAQQRLRSYGPNEVPEKRAHPLLKFLGKFWGLSAWMIELIAILSFILGKRADFIVALALLAINAILSFMQEQRASAAVAALRQKLQVTARTLRDGAWMDLPARELVPGDVVRLRLGDFAPADLQVVAGAVNVDQAALTGESGDVSKNADDSLYAGSTVKEGEATGIVVATGVKTYFGRTTHLVESAHPRLHVEDVITRVVRWLFLIVAIEVALVTGLALSRSYSLAEILPLSLVLLMSAVPVALPVMFTVSMALGSLELGRKGVLVTRLSAAEDAANMDVLCADKTGTLTMNKLSLAGVSAEDGFSADDVMRDGAIASEEADRDAIDLAFIDAARTRHLLDTPPKRISFAPFSARTRKTEAVVEDGAARVRVLKGALRTIAEIAGFDAAGIAALEERAKQGTSAGARVIAVARAAEDARPRLVGMAFLADTLRPDSQGLIAELKALGIGVKMLTGDALAVAQNIGRTLGLGRIASMSRDRSGASVDDLLAGTDGLAEIYPEDKFRVVKSLQNQGHVVAMTGDGVNDAPALRQAEVGIAVSGATDVAKAAASVVLTTEGLGGIVDLVKGGRAIYQRVLTWIVNKVSRTILKSGFVVVAYLATGKFVISAFGMVLLVFMTDFVKIALSTDRVRPSQKPESWNIAPLVRVGVVMGLLMLAEALGFLAFGWRRFGLESNAGRMQAFAFETMLFFALFSLISIRERRAFWASRPSAVLSIALTADAIVGIAIGSVGVAEMAPLPPAQSAMTVAYAMVCALGPNDLVKRLMIRRRRPSQPSAPVRAV